MESGVSLRLARILSADGRAVIAALDHGLPAMTPLQALERPAQLLRLLASAGIDAVMAPAGMVRTFPDEFRGLGVIVRLDGGATTMPGGSGELRQIATVQEACRLGADAIALMGICGAPGESDTLERLGRVAAECHQCGLAVLAEMLPGGYGAKPSPNDLARAARVGTELGADLIKIAYAGPVEAFRTVISSAFAPVLVLGGSSRSSADLHRELSEALSAGAAGVAVGRNLWQAPDPGAAAAALVELVHGRQRP
jgi:DhnA family fructose-bisphosphate aldolase class Ia